MKTFIYVQDKGLAKKILTFTADGVPVGWPFWNCAWQNPQTVTYSAQPLCWNGWETSSPPLTGEQYGKMEPKYPEDGHCQSVLHLQGFFNVPFIIQWRRQRHLTWSATHDVVSREINLWKSFDLLQLATGAQLKLINVQNDYMCMALKL